MASTAVGSADPRISSWLMVFSYLLCGVGFAIGFSQIGDGGAEAIGPVAVLSVGALGIVSFVRHSIFHRSDAARMKWDYGRTNNFQIEAGFANLAWGLVAIAAVIWGWGVAAEAAVTGVFGIYLLGAGILHSLDRGGGPDGGRQSGKTLITAGFFTLITAGCLLFFAIAALCDASIGPF
jgi:hypothetical protein